MNPALHVNGPEGNEAEPLQAPEVLFDEPCRTVLVSYSFACGELCRNGKTLLVEKTGRKWKIAITCGEWVS